MGGFWPKVDSGDFRKHPRVCHGASSPWRLLTPSNPLIPRRGTSKNRNRFQQRDESISSRASASGGRDFNTSNRYDYSGYNKKKSGRDHKSSSLSEQLLTKEKSSVGLLPTPLFCFFFFFNLLQWGRLFGGWLQVLEVVPWFPILPPVQHCDIGFKQMFT